MYVVVLSLSAHVLSLVVVDDDRLGGRGGLPGGVGEMWVFLLDRCGGRGGLWGLCLRLVVVLLCGGAKFGSRYGSGVTLLFLSTHSIITVHLNI